MPVKCGLNSEVAATQRLGIAGVHCSLSAICVHSTFGIQCPFISVETGKMPGMRYILLSHIVGQIFSFYSSALAIIIKPVFHVMLFAHYYLHYKIKNEPFDRKRALMVKS